MFTETLDKLAAVCAVCLLGLFRQLDTQAAGSNGRLGKATGLNACLPFALVIV